MTNLRIGQGYDVHRLTEGRALILGGVTVPYERGLDGHSDADVLTHAIMDALLGAAGLGDIGKLFPDSEERYRGISSLLLLKEVGKRLRENGLQVVNLDSTIVAQAPKLAPYREAMRRVAKTCCVWLGGAAFVLAVIAGYAEMADACVATGAIALGLTTYGIL